MIHENDKEQEDGIQNTGIIANMIDNIENENSKKKLHSMKTTARVFNQNKTKINFKKGKRDEDSSTLKGVSPKVKKMNDAATNISSDHYEFKLGDSMEGNHKSSQVSESKLESDFKFANSTHVSSSFDNDLLSILERK